MGQNQVVPVRMERAEWDQKVKECLEPPDASGVMAAYAYVLTSLYHKPNQDPERAARGLQALVDAELPEVTMPTEWAVLQGTANLVAWAASIRAQVRPAIRVNLDKQLDQIIRYCGFGYVVLQTVSLEEYRELVNKFQRSYDKLAAITSPSFWLESRGESVNTLLIRAERWVDGESDHWSKTFNFKSNVYAADLDGQLTLKRNPNVNIGQAFTYEEAWKLVEAHGKRKEQV